MSKQERSTTPVVSELQEQSQSCPVAILDPPGPRSGQGTEPPAPDEVAEEEFSERLHDAVAQLPRDKQESLLVVLEEAGAKATPRAINEAVCSEEASEERPSTGWPMLDAQLDYLTYCDEAAVLSLLKIAGDHDLITKVKARLAADLAEHVGPLDSPEAISNFVHSEGSADDGGPLTFWLSLPDALTMGRGDTEPAEAQG